MKIAFIMIAPLLYVLSACSEEADAPVYNEEQPVEMPPQPDISQPLTDEILTEDEVDAALEDLEAQRKALENSAGADGDQTAENGSSAVE
ncbi:hypothetical protein AB1K62_12060 [Parasphingorhabdus sp. JC815]|uniref:hypothetical protein n=1 Tax=Parasphingorhabdus sp. JC815 TaxID=3232140 RepID=UPI003457FDC0